MLGIFRYVVLCLTLALSATLAVASDYLFVFQSAFYSNEKSYHFQEKWANDLEKESGGRIKIDLHPGDQGLVDYNETLDAMKLGLLDGHVSLAAFFSDKEPALGLISNTVGAWDNTSQLSDYMYKSGGNELLQEMYAKYNVQLIGTFNEEIEALVSKVPLDGVNDLSGIRIRTSDSMSSKVFESFGAKAVSLPASQIVAAFKKGVIDAADASTFSINQADGLNNIAKHPVYPGFHTLPAIDVSMSKAKWDQLPADLQELFRSSVKAYDQHVSSELKALDKAALNEAKQDSTITVHNWSKEEREKFRKAAKKQWEITSKQSPNAKLVYDSIIAFLEKNNLL